MRKLLPSFFAALTVALCVLPLAAQSFQNPRFFPGSTKPGALFHGDLNGDGFEDVIFGDGNGYQMHVLLSDGAGGFTAGQVLTTSQLTQGACVLRDFNKDGKLDLVCIAQGNGGYSSPPVYIYYGNGDGTFAAPVTLTLPNGGYASIQLLDAGDLNGDGYPDLLTIINGQQTIAILSDGHGGLKVGSTVYSSYSTSAFFADLNGDGKSDELAPGPTVALGKGDGTFGPATAYSPYPSGFNIGSTGCVFADMDGDGHLDAVCGYTTGPNGASNSIVILHGNPDGSFNNTTPLLVMPFGSSSPAGENAGSFASPSYVADVNGDGILDIIGMGVDGLTVYYGKPGLQFAAPVHFAIGQPEWSYFILADVNGDHLPDVLTADYTGLYESLANTNGIFSTARAFEVTGLVNYAAVADFDGDGIPDVVAAGDTFLGFSKGVGDGTFSAYKKLSTGSAGSTGYLYHGDFNGDGKQDLLECGSTSLFSSGYFYYFQGNGDGTFQSPVQAFSCTGSLYAEPLRVADITGDGKDDVLFPPDTSTGTFAVGVSQGNGTFSTRTTSVPVEPSGYMSNLAAETLPSVADFNEDGKMDVVIAARANAYVLQGHGDGTFTELSTLPIPQTYAGTYPDSVATVTGDFDGDGHQDFAVLWDGNSSGYAPGIVFVYYGKGDGTFSAPVIASTAAGSYLDMKAAVLDRSGRASIVLYNHGTVTGSLTEIGILAGSAGRTFGPIVSLAGGAGPSNLQIADLNRDGLQDLIFANHDYNYAANSVTVLLNTTGQVTSTLRASPEPSAAGAGFSLKAALIPPDNSLLTGSVNFTIDGVAAGSALLTANVATLPVSASFAAGLAIGAHSLSAMWAGNATFPAVTLSGTHTIAGIPTALALDSSSPVATVGSPVTFTTTLTTSAMPSPAASGTLTLTDNGSPLHVTMLSAASLPYKDIVTTSALANGSHTIVATFAPASTFAAGSASLTQTINLIATTSLLSASPASVTYGSPITLTASVSAGNAGTPTGNVVFYIDGAAVATVALGAGASSYTVSALAPGGHNFTCTYSGDTMFDTSNCSPVSATVVAASTTLTLTSSANPTTAVTPVTFSAKLLTGTQPVAAQLIAFALDSKPLGAFTTNASGVASTSLTLPTGVHTVAASFAGTTAYTASAAQLTETATANPTTTTLIAAPNPAFQGQAVTIVATVLAATGTATPFGSVTLFDGNTPIAAAATPAMVYGSTLVSAPFTISTLAAGTHSLTATYTPDANSLPSTSLPLALIIAPQDYNMSVSTPVMTIQTEHHGSIGITVTSVGNFNGPIFLSCGAPLPPFATCQLDSQVMLPAGGSAGVTLHIDTDAVLGFKSALDQRSPSQSRRNEIALATLLPLSMLVFTRRRRAFTTLLLAVAVAATLASATGCGDKYPDHTPPGTYDLALTATGQSTGSAIITRKTLHLKLVVTP